MNVATYRLTAEVLPEVNISRTGNRNVNRVREKLQLKNQTVEGPMLQSAGSLPVL